MSACLWSLSTALSLPSRHKVVPEPDRSAEKKQLSKSRCPTRYFAHPRLELCKSLCIPFHAMLRWFLALPRPACADPPSSSILSILSGLCRSSAVGGAGGPWSNSKLRKGRDMLKTEDPPSLFGPWGPGHPKSRLHEGCQHRLFSEDQVRKRSCLEMI